MLADYYFADPRLTLIPIEHLSPAGMSADYAALVSKRRQWDAARIALFDAAFTRYWQRTTALAQRLVHWTAPRLRHVAVVHDAFAVHPYAQLLNTSAWTVYASDLDPTTSHPELGAYLLVHGDRMAQTGEVTQAAVHNAAYWFDRTDDECRAFARAVEQSCRPDADAFRALAAAIKWMRALRHETLRPATPADGPMRAIPRTGLLVPRAVAHEPPKLVARWTAVAEATVAAYHNRWRSPDTRRVTALCDWLRDQHPPLLITAGERIVWDPAHANRLGGLRTLLRGASGAGVADVHADLEIVTARTRAFQRALAEPSMLPPPDASMAPSGYTFIHPARGLIAYNLHEPGMERLRGPSLPYARAMLGARTIHEWSHLAVEAGWVPCTITPAELAQRVRTLAELLEVTIAGEQSPLAKGGLQGGALAQILLARMPDFQSNLLAQRFLTLAERETYVRHNIRTLREVYPHAEQWRALLRYLFEYQYLRFSAVADRRTFFLRSTGFDADFIATGIVDGARFDALVAAVGHICDAYAVDEERFV